MTKLLDEFVKIAKFAGERFDLVQAGGGNNAVKLPNGTMLIKASGYTLSEVSSDNAYSIVSTSMVKRIIHNDSLLKNKNKEAREKACKSLLSEATLHKLKPSIETLLHSMMLKYSLHTHPLALNILLINPNWKSILNKIFFDYPIILVDYHTPGIELGIALSNSLKNFSTPPHIIFLQNHGLIVHSENYEDIEKLTNLVCSRVEKYLKIDHTPYKLCNTISHLLNKVKKHTNVCYLSEDHILNSRLTQNPGLFTKGPFCPDSLVYCGQTPLHINNLNDTLIVDHFLEKYKQLPKVIIFNQRIYFVAQNIYKAKQIEEVYKFHISVLSQCNSHVNYLNEDEICYLNNWDAEKFRQNLLK